VIVVDANLLIYAYDSASSQHPKARTWVEETFSGNLPVGLPWQSIAAFLRIMTSTKLPGHRFTTREAVQIVDSWLAQPNVLALAPGDKYWSLFGPAMVDGQAAGPLVTDAQLAALTFEYGGVLHTTDKDFARFPGLRWTDPLK
jgi:toxin-antitoxin system PIN domain toxin